MKRKIINPLQKILLDSRAIGNILFCCTALSLLLANIGFWNDAYRNIWQATFDGTNNIYTHMGFLLIPNSPTLIINDGLMAVFFFLVGMDIKRELVNGELASVKRSILPVFGALGGMLVPALLFTLLNKGSDFMQGWAIPTATDIAFTLGTMTLPT